jgi:hypothetical protein
MVLLDIAMPQIVEQFPPTRDHFQESTARIIVFFVNLEMLRQFVDPLRQQRDLYLRRPSVASMCFVIVYDLLFYFSNR